MAHDTKPLPFRIAPSDSRSLIDQTAAGIATAIQSGYYPPGLRLPTLSEMSAQLGVSLIVPRRAVARLAREGRLRSARRRGIVVCTPTVRPFRGQVLFLTPGTPGTFYFATRDWAFHEALADAGIRLITVHWGGGRGDHALALLRQALDSGPIDMAVLEHSPWGAEVLEERGVRTLLVFGNRSSPASPEPSGILLDIQTPVRRLMRHLRSCGVRSVGLLAARRSVPLHKEARRARLTIMPIESPEAIESGGDCIAAEATGYAVGMDVARRKDSERPDAICLNDDYMARGLLTAFEQSKVRIPDDIQVAAVLNRGHFPVLGRSITRIEMDPVLGGRVMAKAVMRSLWGGTRASKPFVVVPRFRVGSTTRR